VEEKDVVVIGGGPAGYVAAIRVMQLGGKAALIEEESLGGTCIKRGCIPTSVLVRGTEFLEMPGKARDYGITLKVEEVNLARMMARKDTVVKTVTGGLDLLVKGNGVEVLKGRGRLLSAREVELRQEGGACTKISARQVIIATGSRIRKPLFTGAEESITTDQALDLKEIPRSVLIVGDGTVAFTFAAIFNRLGTQVTVITGSSRILPGVDQEIVTLFLREMKKSKVIVHPRSSIQSVVGNREGQKAVTAVIDGKETTLTCHYVLMAEEREANVDGLGLDAAGVKEGASGIAVNSRMETSVPGVFAAGDATGGRLAHVAFAEGKVAAENALGKDVRMDYAAIPKCLNTIPEIASVGLTEEEAVGQGHSLQIGRFPFAANGMATILGERSGLVKIIADSRYGQTLGVHMIGPQASNLIPESVLAMKVEATPQEIGSAIHIHPSLSEALMEAAMAVTHESIHSLPSG